MSNAEWGMAQAAGFWLKADSHELTAPSYHRSWPIFSNYFSGFFGAAADAKPKGVRNSGAEKNLDRTAPGRPAPEMPSNQAGSDRITTRRWSCVGVSHLSAKRADG